ncbi:NAD(P)H-binding protein [Nonomuraea rhizosphaerae]|uniref:NAD(P)H-binding protein n=1 Tax=Nonomuraea rhizosphaerae TaxID=2665663 RepID=UPI001C600029|nr:NAD(P)H-binding protein [Nonomuraea rhizosphaerae]
MILVTGASGGLAGLVLDRIPEDVEAGSRNPSGVKADVPVRLIDFDDPGTLPAGFAGADTVLLVSAGEAEDDVVIARHAAAIDAAERTGVRHIVYTSITGAGDHLPYALPHRWTERRLKDSPLDWTILRNGLYAELLLLPALDAANTGLLSVPLGEGRLAAVSRDDLADVTAAILVEPAAHRGRVYELVGPVATGGADVAEAVAAATGKEVAYRSGSLGELRDALTGLGLPGWQVPFVVSTYSAVAHGFLAGTDGDLAALLGRPPRPAAEVIAAGLRA